MRTLRPGWADQLGAEFGAGKHPELLVRLARGEAGPKPPKPKRPKSSFVKGGRR